MHCTVAWEYEFGGESEREEEGGREPMHTEEMQIGKRRGEQRNQEEETETENWDREQLISQVD